MLVLVHVIIALSSVVYTSYLFFRPSTAKFRVSYGLIASTLASGTYLVIRTHSPLLQACTTGLAYIVIVSIGLAAAHHRFTTQANKID